MGIFYLSIKSCRNKFFSWASVGLLVFLSAFFWAPSRDGLQAVYALIFFIPMLFILFFKAPDFLEYGGWMTAFAVMYASFSVFSTLWGEPKDFIFFAFQWFVLVCWLCGSCLIFIKYEVDITKYLQLFVIFGALTAVLTVIYYFGVVFSPSYAEARLHGWNVFRNPNEIGAFCGIITLLSIVMAFQSLSLKGSWFFYLIGLMSMIGLITSFSRGALFAFLIMTSIALMVTRPLFKVWFPPFIIIICILMLLFKLNDISLFGDRGIHLGTRAILWKEVFKHSADNIFIGIGMSQNTNIVIPGVEMFNHAHNAWLDTFYRTGLIGLTLIILHFASLLRKISYDARLLPLYFWLGYGCLFNLFDGRCFLGEIGAKWFFYWIPAALITASYTGFYVRELKKRVV